MKRALLIGVQGIGNTVLMTPAVRLLAKAGYQIDVIVSDNGSHEILRASPYVNKLYLWRERDAWIRNLLRLGSRLRLAKYDIAYAMYPNGRRENTLLYLARALRKVCYVDEKHTFRLLSFLPFIEKVRFQRRHDVVSNLSLIGANGSDLSARRPEVSLSGELEEFADSFYTSHDLGARFVVAMQPGGGDFAKRWSKENYIELGLKLTRDPNIKLLVFGSSAEKRLVDGITDALQGRAIAVCNCSINKISALVRRSRLVIGNDSALAHIASAFDIPVVVIWGYTDFRRTAPFSSKGLIIRINYPCSPCYEFATGCITDCQYHLKCIKNISAERVYRIVERYVSLLSSQQSLSAREFEGETFVESVELLEGGCLMVNVSA